MEGRGARRKWLSPSAAIDVDIPNWSEEARNKKENQRFKKHVTRASLVAQWLRVCLLMQGTRVRALVWEDPTCRGATRPVSHNY